MNSKPELFQYVYQQPKPFQKFVYNSFLNKRSTLQSEIVLCGDKTNQVYIICDLYSQIDPPLLSQHVLIHNNQKNQVFMVNSMQQVMPNISYYKYILKNCHIWRKYNRNREEILWRKLTDFKKWELGRVLTNEEEEKIENIIKNDYFDVKCEKKVYLGFTAYIHDNLTNTKKPYAATLYSQAIYDSSDFNTLKPNYGSISGGSEHKLKLSTNWFPNSNDKVLIKLSDEENNWEAFTTGRLDQDCLRFKVPSYTGSWSFEDGNRLIDIEVLDKFEGLPKRCIKFVYT